jgi:DNA-directed RNA polymerase specialized sigma24 family protein
VATQPQPIGKIIFDIEPWMYRWAQVRECASVVSWLRGLVRNEKIAMEMNEKLDRATFCKAAPAPKATRGTNGHKRLLISPEEIQKAIFLREVENLTIAAIAERLNRSEMTVSRMLAARDTPRVEIPRSASRTARGAPIPYSLARSAQR